jgi:hypothetical protein
VHPVRVRLGGRAPGRQIAVGERAQGFPYPLGRSTPLYSSDQPAVATSYLSTKTIEDVWANGSGGVVQRLGGTDGGAAYLGVLFLFVALLVAIAAGQVSATREEEAEGYLDHLLARPVARIPWLAGRFAISAAALTGAGAITGLFTWLGTASSGAELSLATLLAAGFNVVPAGIVVLGIGTLAHRLAPRLATVAAYGVVAWSFIVEIVGASIQWPPAPRRPPAPGVEADAGGRARTVPVQTRPTRGARRAK